MSEWAEFPLWVDGEYKGVLRVPFRRPGLIQLLEGRMESGTDEYDILTEAELVASAAEFQQYYCLPEVKAQGPVEAFSQMIQDLCLARYDGFWGGFRWGVFLGNLVGWPIFALVILVWH